MPYEDDCSIFPEVTATNATPMTTSCSADPSTQVIRGIIKLVAVTYIFVLTVSSVVIPCPKILNEEVLPFEYNQITLRVSFYYQNILRYISVLSIYTDTQRYQPRRVYASTFCERQSSQCEATYTRSSVYILRGACRQTATRSLYQC